MCHVPPNEIHWYGLFIFPRLRCCFCFVDGCLSVFVIFLLSAIRVFIVHTRFLFRSKYREKILISLMNIRNRVEFQIMDRNIIFWFLLLYFFQTFRFDYTEKYRDYIISMEKSFSFLSLLLAVLVARKSEIKSKQYWLLLMLWFQKKLNDWSMIIELIWPYNNEILIYIINPEYEKWIKKI